MSGPFFVGVRPMNLVRPSKKSARVNPRSLSASHSLCEGWRPQRSWNASATFLRVSGDAKAA